MDKALLLAIDQHRARMSEQEHNDALLRDLIDILDVPAAPAGVNGLYRAEDLLRRAGEAREAELSRAGDSLVDTTLDAAWAEAEAALKAAEPAGQRLHLARRHQGYLSWSSSPRGGSWAQGVGDTPAAALRALAAKLRER